MKKFTSGFILGGLIFSFGISFAAATVTKQITASYGVNKVIINGNQAIPTGEEPFINNGRTYVPLRFISENMGYRVKWDKENKNIYIVEESAREKYILGLFDELLVNPQKAEINAKKIVEIMKEKDWSWKKFYEIEGGMAELRFEDESFDFRKASRDLMAWLVEDYKDIDVQSKIRIIIESDLITDGAATEAYYGFIWTLFNEYPVDFIKVLANSNKVSDDKYLVIAQGEALSYEYTSELFTKRVNALKELYNNNLNEKEKTTVKKLIDTLNSKEKSGS